MTLWIEMNDWKESEIICKQSFKLHNFTCDTHSRGNYMTFSWWVFFIDNIIMLYNIVPTSMHEMKCSHSWHISLLRMQNYMNENYRFWYAIIDAHIFAWSTCKMGRNSVWVKSASNGLYVNLMLLAYHVSVTKIKELKVSRNWYLKRIFKELN